MVGSDDIETGALFSPCRTWRYQLWRVWDRPSGMVAWIGLNPSTADETTNDPTVERCQRRTKSMGFGGMFMLNLFGFRATDPKVMKSHPEPVGPDNDERIVDAVTRSRMVVACWGNHGSHQGRAGEVVDLLKRHNVEVHCLGVTNAGQPKHPLYIPYSEGPRRFEL
jgi:hypothetical protein